MSKRTEAAGAVSTAITRTFTLSRPIEHKGEPVGTLTLVEPEIRHMIVAERATSNAKTAVALIAELSGVSETALRRLKIADLRAIETWIRDLRASSACTYAEDGAGGATFTLSAPIEGAGAPLTALRLREPDVEASIAAESFKHPHEITAAMIASLADLTIPTVTRIKLRDLAVIEAWLAPFVLDGASPGAPGAT